MLIPALITMAMAQGSPFRGMVHDNTILLQKDPFDITQAFPVSGSEGRNFVATINGRGQENNLNLAEIDRDGKIRPLMKLSKSGFRHFEAQTLREADGDFWIVAQVSQKQNGGFPDRLPLLVHVSGDGKLLSQNLISGAPGFQKAILNTKGNLYLTSQLPGQEIHLTKVTPDGKAEWTKPALDSKEARFKSVTSIADGSLILFGEKWVASTKIASIYMARMDAQNGLAASSYSSPENLGPVSTVSTANGSIAYTAAGISGGSSQFFVCSTKSLSITKRIPLMDGKIGVVGAMFAHPKRGVYVGFNLQEGPSREASLVRMSYGGTLHEVIDATYRGAGAQSTSFHMDRYEDVYVAGTTNVGAFQTKVGRPTGIIYQQLFQFGEIGSRRPVAFTVNDETGELFLANYGRLAKYSQSPLLYSKTYEIDEDTVVKDKSCLEMDRYTKFGEVVLVSKPSKGTVKLSADGKYTYTPKKGYVGVDGFSYRVNRGNVTSYYGAVVFKVLAKPH